MEMKTKAISQNVITLQITTCNLCTSLGQWQDMFGLTYEELMVKDVFQCCANIEISDGDNPFYLCTSCTMQLIGTYEFIKTCKEAWITHTQTFTQKDDYETLQTINKQAIEDEDQERVSNASDCYEEECESSDKEDELKSDKVNKIKEEAVTLIEVTAPKVKMDSTTDRRKNQKEFEERVYKEIEALHISDAQRKEKIVDNNWDTGDKMVLRKRTIYKCAICQEEFTVKRKYDVHIRNHGGRKKHPGLRCKPCNIIFRAPYLLQQHKLEEHCQETKCFLCDTVMPTIKVLKKHLFIDHTDTHTTPTGSRKEAKMSAFACHVCGKEFNTHASLKLHLYSHLPTNSRVCEFCGERFPSYSQYKRHSKAHVNDKSYRCAVCFKCFKAKVGLIYHIRSAHTNSRPHVCDVCGKDFVQKIHLSMHQRIHTDEKAFMCDLCGKSFRLKATLTGHLRTHTGEKPYGCDKCDKRYASQSNLKKHTAVCGVDLMIRRTGKRV